MTEQPEREQIEGEHILLNEDGDALVLRRTARVDLDEDGVPTRTPLVQVITRQAGTEHALSFGVGQILAAVEGALRPHAAD